jgi:long-chain acyl-CoA synthetase
MQMLGATVIAMQRFDATTVLSLIERHRVSAAQFVPTHFKRLLELDEQVRQRNDLRSLRTVVHAAAPCPPLIKRAMIDWWGPIILEYYAGTEGGGTLIDSRQWLERPGSVGRPWVGLSAAVRDEADEMVATPNKEALIYFRNAAGAVANFAYHKDEAATAAAYHGDWFTLGDIGYFDEEGFLFLTDRMSNMIISGGVNIYPQEAENLLMSHPKVADAAVIGVPDEDMGEAVKAVVVPTAGTVAGPELAEELIRHARSALAGYKCPRSIDFVETLPRTATGKLQKRLLRERYWGTR